MKSYIGKVEELRPTSEGQKVIKTYFMTISEGYPPPAAADALSLTDETNRVTFIMWTEGFTPDQIDGIVRILNAPNPLPNLRDMKEKAHGLTKQEIAAKLDMGCHSFNYSADSGMTSYKNYSRDELLLTCIQFGIDPCK